MGKIQSLISRILLAFVLISLGFVLGKHSVEKDVSTYIDDTKENYIIVYYMHTTFRCVTCNTIEEMTKSLLEQKYKRELEKGIIRWQAVDFQEDKELAKQFDIISSCVVVAEIRGGKLFNYKRLDDVWTFSKDKRQFDKYISDTIDSYLKG